MIGRFCMRLVVALGAAGVLVSGLCQRTSAAPSDTPPSLAAAGHPGFLSPHADPVAIHDEFVFVVNTAADTLDVIDSATRQIVRRISAHSKYLSSAAGLTGKWFVVPRPG